MVVSVCNIAAYVSHTIWRTDNVFSVVLTFYRHHGSELRGNDLMLVFNRAPVWLERMLVILKPKFNIIVNGAWIVNVFKKRS